METHAGQQQLISHEQHIDQTPSKIADVCNVCKKSPASVGTIGRIATEHSELEELFDVTSGSNLNSGKFAILK